MKLISLYLCWYETVCGGGILCLVLSSNNNGPFSKIAIIIHATNKTWPESFATATTTDDAVWNRNHADDG